MRVLVTGGRNFADADLLETTLNAVHESEKISVLIHGADQRRRSYVRQ